MVPRGRLVLVCALLALAAGAVSALGSPAHRPAPCRFITAPRARAAFCDTFSRPLGTPGTRSGQLDGIVWGVSRATSLNDPARSLLYDWAAVRRDTCGRFEIVRPENDVAVCHGQAVEAVNDNGGVADLAMYPRQPFDFAGRTGTVEFDVSDNTQGPHAAWPAFLITDQPVPAPYEQSAGVDDHARNSVGFTLAGLCGQHGCGTNLPPGAGSPGFHCITVDTLFVTRDYRQHDVAIKQDGCVLPSQHLGSDNHVEVRINSGGMRVYASDPGQPGSTRLIAHASFRVPLTRGLIWIEDVHFNGDAINQQQTDTFSWDNVAFDGPVLPRDLGFDVLDNTAPGPRAVNGLSTVNIGYLVPAHRTLELTIPRVRDLDRAAAALLELTYWPEHPQAISYSLNGHATHRFAWPFARQAAAASETVAMPVALTDLRDGANVLRLRTSDPAGVAIANIDLILHGAGGVHPPG